VLRIGPDLEHRAVPELQPRALDENQYPLVGQDSSGEMDFPPLCRRSRLRLSLCRAVRDRIHEQAGGEQGS
jgi:hypothetical protein